MERCTAHDEVNVEVARRLSSHECKYKGLCKWLECIVEAFLRGHQDMGSDLKMAEDFLRLHCQLLKDLDEKEGELNRLPGEIDSIRGRLDYATLDDLDQSLTSLRDTWNKMRKTLKSRIELASVYVKFHGLAEDLNRKIDEFEGLLKRYPETLDRTKIDETSSRWSAMQPIYVEITAQGNYFIGEAKKVCLNYIVAS